MKKNIEKKTKLKRFKIPIDIFDTEVQVWVGDIRECAKDAEKRYPGKYLEKGINYPVDAVAFGGHYNTDLRVFGILLSYDSAFGSIFHESLHVAWFILDNIGIEIDSYNNEILAYLQEFIAKKLMDKLKVIRLTQT